jgi:hypothetical protein
LKEPRKPIEEPLQEGAAKDYEPTKSRIKPSLKSMLRDQEETTTISSVGRLIDSHSIDFVEVRLSRDRDVGTREYREFGVTGLAKRRYLGVKVLTLVPTPFVL